MTINIEELKNDLTRLHDSLEEHVTCVRVLKIKYDYMNPDEVLSLIKETPELSEIVDKIGILEKELQ